MFIGKIYVKMSVIFPDLIEGESAMEANILIFSVSIGAGHNSAARAIVQQCKKQNGGSKTSIIDTLDFINPLFHKVLEGSYLSTLKFNPKLWGYIYDYTEASRQSSGVNEAMAYISYHKIIDLIERFQPHIIIATHAFPAGILSAIKERTGMTIPLVSIVTDYGVHAFWIHSHMDLYFIPSEMMKHECLEKGIPEEKLVFKGIPLREDFAKAYDPVATRAKLGLDGRPVILVMGGGIGLGSVYTATKMILEMKKDFQVIAVAGKNEDLYHKLCRLAEGNPDVQVFSYVENVAELMSVADLLIGKSGGLTVTEALAMQLPMIILNPLPGQETRNADFLTNLGMAALVRDIEELPNLIDCLTRVPMRLEYMRLMAAEFGRKDAAAAVYDTLARLYLGPGREAKPC